MIRGARYQKGYQHKKWELANEVQIPIKVILR